MNAKQSKRQRDIKSKLMAAICMLLVSSIMMVSTTYAWFTLSTAPEVTGITTAVGANGNLEMALMPLSGNTADITSAVGDSMAVKNAYEANTTWGNLVDLSDTTYYGLDKITLYPSQLNLDGDKIASAPLLTPVYGSDGRVASLAGKTIAGSYDGTKFVEKVTIGSGEAAKQVNAMGVRAIGTSSTLTDRELAYRALISEASSAGSMAQRTASGALTTNGNVLANVAITHATNSEATISPREVQAMKDICTALLGTDSSTGALDYIENALKQYIIAHNLATASDDSFEDLQAAMQKMTLADLKTATSVTGEKGTYTITLPDGMVGDPGYIAKLETSIANTTTAQTTLNDLGTKDSYTWDEVKTALYALADPDNMEVNSIPVKDLTKEENGEKVNMNKLVSAVMGEGLKLSLGTGAGVFADIADFGGDYSCTITINQISYGGLTVPNVPATMATKTSVNPVYLTQASTNTKPFQAGSGETAASAAITDYYGYVIDLAFRTNVSGSYLQLQTKAVDRVYSDSSNAETMGGGASMSFTATTSSFDAYVSSLMKNIRVVFFEPTTKKVVGYARLDTATANQDANGKVTMDLVMTDAEGNAKTDAKIMELDQNTIHQLSVMVYLDGTTITNADVSNAVKSMVGTMNLQFSSSATLDPMDYSDLKNGTGTTTAKTITLSNVDSSALNTTVKYAVYKDGAVGVLFNSTVTGTVQATVGGKTYTMTSGEVTMGTEKLTGYTFTPDAGVSIEATTRITLTLEGTSSETPDTTSYTVTLSAPDGITSTGATTTDGSADYTFGLSGTTEGTTYTVSYTSGSNSGTLTAAGGTYTISKDSIAGNIVITVTAN